MFTGSEEVVGCVSLVVAGGGFSVAGGVTYLVVEPEGGCALEEVVGHVSFGRSWWWLLSCRWSDISRS